MKTIKAQLISELKKGSYYQLVSYWNMFCDHNRDHENRIYANTEAVLNAVFKDKTPAQILYINNYDPSHAYFVLGVFGLLSFNDPREIVDFNELADFIIENKMQWEILE